MTQADLAKKIREPAAIIISYEKGDAAPNQGVLGKIERTLNVKLRGKESEIGLPLDPTKPPYNEAAPAASTTATKKK